MEARRRSPHARLTRASLPALAAFARGYLHQDLTLQYGTAAAALSAFCHDADVGERDDLAADLTRLAKRAQGWSHARLATFFVRELGAAWAPATLDDLRALEREARQSTD